MSTTKTTLEMSETLFRRAKAAAASRGQTLKQFVTEALERELGSSESGVVVSASTALRKVRQLAKINAASWQTDQDSVAAVREQRRG
jgi:3-dehydroquinate synthase class II